MQKALTTKLVLCIIVKESSKFINSQPKDFSLDWGELVLFFCFSSSFIISSNRLEAFSLEPSKLDLKTDLLIFSIQTIHLLDVIFYHYTIYHIV